MQQILALVVLVLTIQFAFADIIWTGNTNVYNWTVLGSATITSNGAISMTNNVSQIGNIWWGQRQKVHYGFEATFAVQCIPSTLSPFAAGFSFILNSLSNAAVGTNVSGLGYDFKSNLAIEFDTYHDPKNEDPYYNHIGLMVPQLGLSTSPDHSLSNPGVPVSFSLCDGSVVVYKVVYYYTTKVVEVSQGNTVLLSTPLNPTGLAALNNPWIGFGASTMKYYYEKVIISNLTFYESSAIFSVYPNESSMNGGVVVSITGVNFGTSSTCYFVSKNGTVKAIAATTISSTVVSCIAPAFNQENVTLYVKPTNTTYHSSDIGATFYYEAIPNTPTLSGIAFMDTIVLKWNVVNPYNFPLSFTAQYSSIAGNISTIFYQGRNNTATLANLLPYTTYYIKVQASNAAGVGNFSAILSLNTTAGPPVQISTLLIQSATVKSISVVWTAPDNRGSPIKSALVQYATNAYGPFTNITINSNALSYNITGLAMRTQYYIRVAVANALGFSQFSSILTASTAAGCGDNVCDENYESCFTCSDCWCNVPGWKVESYISGSLVSTTLVDSTATPQFLVFKNTTYNFNGYTTVSVSKDYRFSVSAKPSTTSQMTVYINGIPVTGGAVSGYNKRYDFTYYMEASKRYYFMVVFKSDDNSYMQLWWDQGNAAGNVVYFLSAFYSSSVCGDDICSRDENAANCADDCVIASCGDGFCNHHENTTTCYVDCFGVHSHSYQTHDCAYKVPQSNVQPGIPLSGDSLGQIISNNMLWSLPGVDHLAHGVNIFTGLEEISPLFQFTYCKGNDSRELQDSYRGYIYQIPEQVNADAFPSCTFSAATQTYSSSYSYSQERSQQTQVSGSLSAGYSGYGFHAAASLAFSQDVTSTSASESQSEQSGTLSITSVSCFTSKMEMRNLNLHDSFIEALETAVDADDFANIVKRYGSHYYTTAQLGGKLTMTMSIAQSLSSSFDSNSLSTMATRSFSASVSGWGASGSAAASYAQSVSDSSSSQSQFESSTSKSTIITYGGAPGSFGPSGGSNTDAPGNWGDWAQTVDLLPVPIEYTLDRIYNIVPEKYKKLWLEGEDLFYATYSNSLGFNNQYLLEVTYNATDNIGPIGVILNGELNNNKGTTVTTILANDNYTSSIANSPAVYKILSPTDEYSQQIRFTFHENEIGPLYSVELCFKCVQGISTVGNLTSANVRSARFVDYNSAREYFLRPTTTAQLYITLTPEYPYSPHYDIIFSVFMGYQVAESFPQYELNIELEIIGSKGHLVQIIKSTRLFDALFSNTNVEIAIPQKTSIGELWYFNMIPIYPQTGLPDQKRYAATIQNIRIVDYFSSNNSLVYVTTPAQPHGYQFVSGIGNFSTSNVHAQLTLASPNLIPLLF